MADYLSIIDEHIKDLDGRMVPAWIIHSALVTSKALSIGKKYMERTGEKVDLRLLEEIGMLHDIGIFETSVPHADLTGPDPYVTHILHGHRILLEKGLQAHASAARTHMNVPAFEVRDQDMPLPEEDHVPITTEEDILCLADYYFRKIFDRLFNEQTDDEVQEHLSQFSQDAADRFDVLRTKYID